MKINTFLTLYKSNGNENRQKELLYSRIKNKYMPVLEKQELAKRIIKSSTLGNGSVSTVYKYIFTIIETIKAYTDFEISTKPKDAIESFDTLNSNGLVDLILHLIDQKELSELNMIIRMEFEDM